MTQEKSPQGRGAAITGGEQWTDKSQRPGDGFTPPRNHFLRAISLVGQRENLTPMAKLGVLAFWRIVGTGRIPIGPCLHAYILGQHLEHAKDILKRLKNKVCLGSPGRAERQQQERR